MSYVPQILIVDDDPRMCDSLKVLLGNEGYEIQTRRNGQEALEAFVKNDFDIVLLDLILPDINGAEIMDHIESQSPETLAILMTGHASIESAVQALRNRAYDYLRKPFEHEELLKTVRNALDQKRLKCERNQIEIAFKQSERKLRSIIERVPDVIYQLDSDGRITFISKSVETLLKYSQKELIGKGILELVHSRDIEKARYKIAERRRGSSLSHPDNTEKAHYRLRERRALSKEGTDLLEVRLVRKDKAAVHVLITTSEGVYEAGRFIGTLGIAKDITRRKLAEEELLKTNQELKSFVRVVSHDLKAPIAHIQGFSSVLLENYQENMDEKGRICLERIDASARRMEALVSDLLGLSKSGQVVSTFTEIPSIEIIENVTSELQHRLEGEGIELVVADNLPDIYCDGARMYQVFENLLINAVKFTVGADNRKIEIGYEDGGGFHQFHVRDNGIGIDPKYHRKIFEMFHRLREIEDEGGTGLGLAIIERIVNNHGGKVWVESEKGKGATFYFTLLKAPSPPSIL
jgi:signal transduction histidine kinase/FixJ family two-component response regulator